jgi:polyisoprenoid-binding protein YceI
VVPHPAAQASVKEKSRMNKLTTAVVASLVVVASAALAPAQTRFKVDPVHSFVVFKVGHLGVSNAWGRFSDPQGAIVWDENDPSKGKIEVTLQADKIDTGNPKRDQHLKSPDFFNAKQFPTLTFKSNAITKKTEGEYEVSGDFTVHGVTRPMTVTVKKVGEADTQMGHRAGWETSFTVKRSDFGMNFMPGGIGDEVMLHVAIEGVRE